MGADIDTLQGLVDSGTGAAPEGGTEQLPVETGLGTEAPLEPQPGEGGEMPPVEGEGAQPAEPAPSPLQEETPPLPANVYKAIRELRTTAPQHASALRELQAAYGRWKGFTEVYPTVEEARGAQATIDAFGGFDGLMEMQKLGDRVADIDDMLDHGDGRLIEEMSQASPEGFKKLVPEALSILQKMDQQAYFLAVMRPILDTLDGQGATGALSEALQELKTGTADGVARAGAKIQAVEEWIKKLRGMDDEIKNRYKDPRVNELQKQQEQVRTEKRQMLEQHVGRDLDSYMRSTVRPVLQTWSKGRNLTAKAIEDLENASIVEIARRLGPGTFFDTSLKNLLRQTNSGQATIDTITRFAKPQIDKVRKDAIKAVVELRYGPEKPPVRRVAPQEPIYQPQQPQQQAPRVGGGLNPNKPIPIAVKPRIEELDMSKDPNQLMYITGRGYLKANGKLVSWRPGRIGPGAPRA